MSDERKDELKFTECTGPNSFKAVRRNDEGEHEMKVWVPKPGEPLPEGAEALSMGFECRDGWHDVETVYRNGPAQVATPKYRDGYDRIFGKKTDVGLA
jgi:hypothetical protein